MLTRVTYQINTNGVVRTYTAYIYLVFNHLGLYYAIVIDDARNRIFNDSGTDQQLLKEDVEEFVNMLGMVVSETTG